MDNHRDFFTTNNYTEDGAEVRVIGKYPSQGKWALEIAREPRLTSVEMDIEGLNDLINDLCDLREYLKACMKLKQDRDKKMS